MINTASMIARNAQRDPDGVALVGVEETITHAALQARVGALAGALAAREIGRGDVVALVSENRVEFVEALLAINRLGAIFLPLNYRLAAPEWQYIIDHSGASLIIAEPDLWEQLAPVMPDLDHLLFGHQLNSERNARAGADPPTVDVSLTDTQRLMYTSGTTARPKGVRLNYGNWLFKCRGFEIEFGLSADDRILIPGPLYHVGALDLPGIGVLAYGGSMIVMRRFDAGRVLDAIESERPTGIWLAPAMVGALLACEDLPARTLDSVRFIIGGGEKMPEPRMRRLLEVFPNCRIADAYGLTETCGGDTYMDRDSALSRLGSVGRPVAHLEVRIDPVDPAEPSVGEICLRGPKVFDGYWRDPKATAAAIRDGWFHTGDVGQLDPDGYLTIIDRMGDMIISGGENIASSEVERVIYEHEAVSEAAVVATASQRWGEVPKAFVVLVPDAVLDRDELIAHCRERLARYKVPREVVYLDELPRNPSGKVLKRLLR